MSSVRGCRFFILFFSRSSTPPAPIHFTQPFMLINYTRIYIYHAFLLLVKLVNRLKEESIFLQVTNPTMRGPGPPGVCVIKFSKKIRDLFAYS